MKRKLYIYLFTLSISLALSFSDAASRGHQPKPFSRSVPDTTVSGDKQLSPDYEKLLDKVLSYQNVADSLMRVADHYRHQLKSDPRIDKTALKIKINEIEQIAGENQKMAGEVFGKEEVRKEKVVTQVQKPAEIYSIFEVKANPVFSPSDKIPVNSEVPSGLIYRIQLAVFKKIVAPSYFKGISPIYGFQAAGSDITNYYAGMFRKMSDASKALVKVKAAGFRDAFVVALLDKKIVSVERAASLEKEWGKKPLFTSPVTSVEEIPRDTVPPTLIFRVEVTRSPKPLKTEQMDLIKRLAGNRGLDIITNGSGQNIYLIGKFLTFESATEYADLLKLNGQKDAKVAAYLGRREIPVETARQLFEKN